MPRKFRFINNSSATLETDLHLYREEVAYQFGMDIQQLMLSNITLSMVNMSAAMIAIHNPQTNWPRFRETCMATLTATATTFKDKLLELELDTILNALSPLAYLGDAKTEEQADLLSQLLHEQVVQRVSPTLWALDEILATDIKSDNDGS